MKRSRCISPRLLCLAAAVLLSWTAVSARGMQTRQNRIRFDRLPEWVREASQRTVPPGTDAAVVWLHQEKVVEPLAEGGVRVLYRRAGKLMDVAGRESLVHLGHDYRKEDREPSIRAWTVLPDGTARKALADPDAGDIFDVPYVEGGSDYSDTRMMSAIAPGAVPGSVVAHEFEVVRHLDMGGISMLFGDPYYPTVHSRFELHLPETWGRSISVSRGEALRREESGRSVIFTATGLQRLPYEELRPSRDELLPLVWVHWWSPDGSRGFRDWDQVGTWYADLADPVLHEKGEAEELGRMLAPERPEGFLEAVEKAFDFVARKVRYVAIHIGIGGWKPSTPEEVCANRYGDCKDKSFLLRAIFDEWDARSYAVLVRTKEAGPLRRDVPCAGVFDHLIAAVALPEGVGGDLWPVLDVEGVGRLLFLDATVSGGDPWNLRRDVQGTTALLVLPGGGRLIELPSQPPEAARTRRSLRAVVDRSGFLQEAEFVVTYEGVSAGRARMHLAGVSEDDFRREVFADLQDAFPGASLAAFDVQGLDRYDRPVRVTFHMHGGKFGKRVGDLLILEPGRCAEGVVGFHLPPPPRKWDLRFWMPEQEEVDLRIELPAGWSPEELPRGMEFRIQELSCRSDWTMEEGALVYRRTVTRHEDTIVPERYEAFRDAVMRANREASQGVVFLEDQESVPYFQPSNQPR